MKGFAILAVLGMLLAMAGCNKSGGLGAAVEKTNAPNIVGKWKGEIEMPKASKDDPMAEFGSAFAKMFLGNLTLEFTENDRFKMTMMGIPVEGKVERKGLELTLTAETAAGMPMDEARKNNPATPKNDKMSATIAEDGSKIAIKGTDDKTGEPGMVFTRWKDEPKKDVKSTVSAEEEKVLGTYKPDVQASKPANMDAKAAEEWKMGEMLLASATLDLRADNTFTLNLMLEMEGSWKIQGGRVVLHMEKLAGLPDDGKSTSKSDDLNLLIKSDGSLEADKAGPEGQKLIFRKE